MQRANSEKVVYGTARLSEVQSNAMDG
jgi:hypothetical protein